MKAALHMNNAYGGSFTAGEEILRENMRRESKFKLLQVGIISALLLRKLPRKEFQFHSIMQARQHSERFGCSQQSQKSNQAQRPKASFEQKAKNKTLRRQK